jgi:probable rRNA maturation factor
MILLDPDLEPESPRGPRPVRGGPDPDPAPKATSVMRTDALAQKRNSTRNSKTTGHDFRLPSVRGLARFLADAQAAVRLRGQVSVLLTTDAAIARLNGEFRGKKKATDVLSFPAAGVGAEGMAGDLAVSVETALRQAEEQGHALAVEIKVLVLHGLLHLAGFDHEVDDGRMARREKALRARLGLPLGLIERAGVPTLSPEKRRKDGARGIGGGAEKKTERIPSRAKARTRSGRVNVRAETRTLHAEARTVRMTAGYAGAKARLEFASSSARLKSCPFKTTARPVVMAKAGRV